MYISLTYTAYNKRPLQEVAMIDELLRNMREWMNQQRRLMRKKISFGTVIFTT